MTAAALIAKALAIDAVIDKREKALVEELKPFKEGRKLIEGMLLEMLNAQGANHFATDEGTAYKSTIMQPKVVDRDAYVKAVLENWDAYGSEMLLASPQKDAVKQYIEANQAPPPGIDVTYFVRINIRRS